MYLHPQCPVNVWEWAEMIVLGPTNLVQPSATTSPSHSGCSHSSYLPPSTIPTNQLRNTQPTPADLPSVVHWFAGASSDPDWASWDFT